MTQAELRYLSTMPNRLADIEEQLRNLNETMNYIANILAERKAL